MIELKIIPDPFLHIYELCQKYKRVFGCAFVHSLNSNMFNKLLEHLQSNFNSDQSMGIFYGLPLLLELDPEEKEKRTDFEARIKVIVQEFEKANSLPPNKIVPFTRRFTHLMPVEYIESMFTLGFFRDKKQRTITNNTPLN